MESAKVASDIICLFGICFVKKRRSKYTHPTCGTVPSYMINLNPEFRPGKSVKTCPE